MNFSAVNGLAGVENHRLNLRSFQLNMARFWVEDAIGIFVAIGTDWFLTRAPAAIARHGRRAADKPASPPPFSNEIRPAIDDDRQ